MCLTYYKYDTCQDWMLWIGGIVLLLVLMIALGKGNVRANALMIVIIAGIIGFYYLLGGLLITFPWVFVGVIILGIALIGSLIFRR